MVWMCLVTAAISIAASYALMQRRPTPPDNDADVRLLAARVADLEAATPPIRWWCHAGQSTCFRDKAECARTHVQAEAGCEGRPLAYCDAKALVCYGDIAVCRMDDRGEMTRVCFGVE